MVYYIMKKKKKIHFHQVFPHGGQYNIKEIRKNVQKQPDKKAPDEICSKHLQMMLLDRCRRKLNKVIFPLQNTNWKTDFIFKNSILSLPADISGKLTHFYLWYIFQRKVARSTVWPHLFQSGFYFPFQLYAGGKPSSK